MRKYFKFITVCAAALLCIATDALAQVEVAPWGNVVGIRVEGQLMDFETSLCTIGVDGRVNRTGKERQRPRYTRDGAVQTVTTRLGDLAFTKVVTDQGPDAAAVSVQVASEADTSLTGVYLCIDLPAAYTGGTVQVMGAGQPSAGVSLAEPSTGGQAEYLQAITGGVQFRASDRRLDVAFAEPAEVVVRNEGQGSGIRAYLRLLPGGIRGGDAAQNTFTFRASGEIDRSPVEVVLHADRPGRAFDGLGGNFRIQNPRVDPGVIAYNLENLPVRWGRVEMPWRLWQPEEETDPLAAAERGELHPRVQSAMEMARTLARMDMPVIVSAWFPPQWAVLGEVRGRHPDGSFGNALDPAKMDQIYASLTSYLTYLKDHYGVEAVMFSFNESDLGIDVRQTAEEHRALIKGLGAYLGEQGLATRMLLGDNSDATTTEFIRPVMQDSAAWPYVGAVSFHSWRGWSDSLLTFWGDAARTLNVPLLIGEGSTDAAAWTYPAAFQEPLFAMEEINLYVRILALAQPKSILQWQLTGDYSILTGGGVFGSEGPLRPTQRFWNLKQLASTPAGAFALPVSCGAPAITCAAFGDIAGGAYTLHLVNNGAARPVTLTGLPPGLTALRIYVTDPRRGMEAQGSIPVTNGQTTFTLDAAAFTSLMGEE